MALDSVQPGRPRKVDVGSTISKDSKTRSNRQADEPSRMPVAERGRLRSNANWEGHRLRLRQRKSSMSGSPNWPGVAASKVGAPTENRNCATASCGIEGCPQRHPRGGPEEGIVRAGSTLLQTGCGLDGP